MIKIGGNVAAYISSKSLLMCVCCTVWK